jgi:hypothetical protein
MSPYKGNWDRLYQKLKIFNKGYALDESQYDSSLRSYLMWGCAKFRWEMLSEEYQTLENLQRIRTYYRNLVNTLVICPDGVIVMKKTGNPSGSVNTISDNTLILYTLLAYAWIMNSSNELRSYESFEMHTAKALVGDDNTWTVSDEAHVFYNAVTVIEQWKKLGITTTTDALYPRKPEELDFLSAHTVFLFGKAVPIYSRVKLMNSLLYAPKEHLTPAITLERTAALLSVGWTDLPFRRFCRDVIGWLLEKYDPILYDEPRWIMAKCQIQSDDRYFRLFTGERQILRPQGFISGELVKLTQPEKNTMQRVNPKRNGTKPGKKTTPRKSRAKRTRTGRQNVVVSPQQQVVRIQRRRPRRGVREQRPQGMYARQLTMQGSSRTLMRAKRSCTVEEDEFIAAVNGSVGFVNVAYPINPGQATTFPWLAKQAAQWEKYHFNYLEFYYKRDVSEFATNGSTGKVIMSVDFDASDSPPATKQQIEDTDPRVDGMPCENISLPLNQREMHSLFSTLYVRPGGLPGATDIKTYDAGNLNIATQGCANTTEIGELRVRYSVTFSVPVLENNAAAPANNSVSQFYTTNTTYTTGVTTTVLLGGNGAAFTNGLGITNVNGVLTPPPGNYLVDTVASMTDGSNEAVSGFLTLEKNAALIAGIPTIGFRDNSALSSALVSATLPAFVTANGTDQFIVLLQLTGAAGTLQATVVMRWVAI